MRILATPEELQSGLKALDGAPAYFVDTEFESSRRGTQLSLIQVSAGEEVYLVDALQLPSLRELGDVMCREQCQWVLHAGLQDVELLLQAFEREEPPSLLDTQVAYGLVGPEAGVSLAFLQFKLLGVRASKGYQADDWLRRPLPRAQLEYAASDIAHLPALERELRRRAGELGREDALHAASRDFLRPQREPPNPLSFESFRNAWQLDASGQTGLRLLIAWYNECLLPEAQSKTKTIQSRTLLSIASRAPRSVQDLGRIKGVSSHFCRTHGRQVISLMQRARTETEGGQDLAPPAYASFEDFLIEARLQLVRAELCAELCLAPDIALPVSLVKRMNQRAKSAGRLAAAVDELNGWRSEILAATFVRLARRFDA